MAKNLHAGMGELRGKFFGIAGNEFASDKKSSFFVRARFEPRVQGIMQTFSRRATADKKHRQSTVGFRILPTSKKKFFIKSVLMPRQFFHRETPVKKSPRNKIRRAQQTISQFVFLLFFAEIFGVEGVFVAGWHRDSEPLTF